MTEITDVPNVLYDCILNRRNVTEIEEGARKLEILLQNESSKKLIDAARSNFNFLSYHDDNLAKFRDQLKISTEKNHSQEAKIIKAIDLVKIGYYKQTTLHCFDVTNLPPKYNGYGYSGLYVRLCWNKTELFSTVKPELFWKLFNCDVQLGVDVTLVYYWTCRYGGFSCIKVITKFKVIVLNFHSG